MHGGRKMTKINTTVKEVMRMKELVVETGKKKAAAEGEQKVLFLGLKTEHKITSLKQLSNKIDNCLDELELLESDVINGVEQIRQQYNFGGICTD